MTDLDSGDFVRDDEYEWQPCFLVWPRIGLLLSHYGVRRRLIWPGRYLVRRSRTYLGWMYRRHREGPTAQD